MVIALGLNRSRCVADRGLVDGSMCLVILNIFGSSVSGRFVAVLDFLLCVLFLVSGIGRSGAPLTSGHF